MEFKIFDHAIHIIFIRMFIDSNDRHYILQVFGMTGNCLNVIVFWRIGLKDSVSSSFFALSISDLSYLLTNFFVWMLYLLHRLVVDSWIKFNDVSFFIVWYAHWFMATSVLITTYIAIQRCCCVALPLKMKSFFTTRRNAGIILSLFLITTALYLPILSGRGIKMYVDPTTNSSWIGVWRNANQDYIVEVLDYIVGMLLPIVTQAITVTCMIILVTSLRISSKFRQSAKATGTDSNVGQKVKAKSKDIQVVKAVTFVTLIFILSNTLPIVFALTRRIEPRFNNWQRYWRLFIIMAILKDTVQQLSASLNILVYYSFNTAYKNTLRNLFSGRFDVQKQVKNAP